MNREQLLEAMRATAKPKLIPVKVDGWGTLHVSPPTVEEVDEASNHVEPDEGKKRTLSRAAARIICDEKGKRLFDPQSKADLDLLATQPWSMLQKVLAAAEAKGTDASGN